MRSAADAGRAASSEGSPTLAPGPTVEVGQLLDRCRFPAAGTAVVCGVSGGPDSLALLVLAVAAGLDVVAVHVDHGLRPDSAAEAEVVAAAAGRFGARFRAERADVDPGPDLENRARVARHRALGPGALTGHTADDQAETVLINLLRGAGPSGLAAMTPGGTHPLLDLRRWETVALCRGLGLDPVADPSNLDPRFVRNRLRHEVLPLLADVAGRDPVPLLTRAAGHTRELVAAVDELATELDPTDTRALAAAPPALARARLRAWLRNPEGHPPSSAELERVLAVVRHEAVGCELAGGRRVRRSGGVLRIDEPSGPAEPRDGQKRHAEPRNGGGPGAGPGEAS